MTDDANANADADLRPKEEASVEEPEHPKTPAISEEPGGIVQSVSKNSVANFSFSIWPPTQRTRDAIVKRLVDTLSSPSVLSNRYGVIPVEEAKEAANRIEGEAFAAANVATMPPDEDGIEILQVYSKQISRRMIETVKARSAPATAVAADAPQTPNVDDVAVAGEKEVEDAAAKD